MKPTDNKKADEIWDKCHPKCSTLRETWRMAMEEYHQYRMEEVTDEMIEKMAEKYFPFEVAKSTNTHGDDYNRPKIYGFKLGAKAFRDGKITNH
jgi:hypothetical protein